MVLNFMQSLTSRQMRFKVIRLNNLKVGWDLLFNHLSMINDKIELDCLNISFDAYKVSCKKLCLGWTGLHAW